MGPKVNPDKNTVTEMNSTFGTSKKVNPKPIAIDVNIEALTISSRRIFFSNGPLK